MWIILISSSTTLMLYQIAISFEHYLSNDAKVCVVHVLMIKDYTVKDVDCRVKNMLTNVCKCLSRVSHVIRSLHLLHYNTVLTYGSKK